VFKYSSLKLKIRAWNLCIAYLDSRSWKTFVKDVLIL